MKKLKKLVFTGIVLLLLGLACAAGLVKLQMKLGLDRWIATAQAAHPCPNDDLDALLAYLESEEHSLIDRNHVVWAIGVMRDPRALPTLEKYYTGGECDHDRILCQYELEKAIRLCSRRETQ